MSGSKEFTIAVYRQFSMLNFITLTFERMNSEITLNDSFKMCN